MMLFMIENSLLRQSVSSSLEALELSLRRLQSIRMCTLYGYWIRTLSSDRMTTGKDRAKEN